MHRISVELGQRTYPILIGPGARAAFQEGNIWRGRPPAQVVVIADASVAKLHGNRLGESLPPDTVVLTFPAGEGSKTIATAERLFAALAAARIERSAVVVGFGGGVAGDLAGFVAATWLRGVRLVQVPTSLLAAIDASVGGKTGVNLPAGKNLVGAFHQPQAVVIDTDFLQTLPQREFVSGLAESVKHAAIRDPGFLGWHEQHTGDILSRDEATLGELIARNCAIKAEVVARDEREVGLRANLNYGHTVGHALEHVLNFELRHGECIALGILVENELARARALLTAEEAGRVGSLLMRLGLPPRLPRRIEPADVLAACRIDKKVHGGKVHFILLQGIGHPVRVTDVTADQIAAALELIQPA